MACEGTRFTEKKRIESMKYAVEKKLPELKYHILPRTRGFTLILHGAKGKSKIQWKMFLKRKKFPNEYLLISTGCL